MTESYMLKPEDRSRLTRKMLLSNLGSLGVLLFGLIGFILYIRPSLAGVGPESSGTYQGAMVWLLTGILFTVAGAAFLFISIRWPRQLKKTVLHALPVPMTLELGIEEDSESTAYIAILTERDGGGEQIPGWRAQIWVHPPDVREDAGKQLDCGVFFHPETGRPAAVEYARGILWVMAGSGAVQRLGNRNGTDAGNR